jgi:pimeloyl-ACP methyl ester carboxylesterase
VQREVAKFAYACWYDRAGYGWSEPGPIPVVSRVRANDLHTLLKVAGVRAPYVLVGRREGGLHVRVYAGAYPAEVAGLVLMDSNEPIETTTTSRTAGDSAGPIARHFGSMAPYVRRASCKVLPLLVYTGMVRLLGGRPRHTTPLGSERLSPDEERKIDFLSDRYTPGEACAREESVAEVRAAGGLGDRPVVILTSANLLASMRGDQGNNPTDQDWVRLQAQLASLSSQAHQVLLDDQKDASRAVVDAVRAVVGEVQTN